MQYVKMALYEYNELSDEIKQEILINYINTIISNAKAKGIDNIDDSKFIEAYHQCEIAGTPELIGSIYYHSKKEDIDSHIDELLYYPNGDPCILKARARLCNKMDWAVNENNF